MDSVTNIRLRNLEQRLEKFEDRIKNIESIFTKEGENSIIPIPPQGKNLPNLNKEWQDTTEKCEKCGGILQRNNMITLTSNPPQYLYRCKECEYCEYRRY